MMYQRLFLAALLFGSVEQMCAAQTARTALMVKNFFDQVTKNNTLPASSWLPDFLQERITRSSAHDELTRRIENHEVLDPLFVRVYFDKFFDNEADARVPYFFAMQVEVNELMRKFIELGCYIKEGPEKVEELKSYGIEADKMDAVTEEEYRERVNKKECVKEARYKVRLEESGKFAKLLLEELKKVQ